MKKIPMRRCVVCHESFPKKELIRVVKTTTGDVVVDVTGKINGHGAYLKKDIKMLEMAKSKNILERALETEIPETVYQQLEKIINE